MSSKLKQEFQDKLEWLFDGQTYQLKAMVWPMPGSAPKNTRKRILSSIYDLQEIAEEQLLQSKHSKRILRDYDHRKNWHPKKGKGHGIDAKKKNFKKWYEKHITTQNCVYAFWSKSQCLYIGRTLNGKGRPSSHFDKHWFAKATRLDIYGFNRKRDVPRFECMLTHRDLPIRLKMKPGAKKYYSQCPVCDIHRKIKSEMKNIFRPR